MRSSHVFVNSIVLNLSHIIILINIPVKTDNVQFKVLNDCSCVGSVMSYKCSVVGDGYTVWRGSAFDCNNSGNEIILLHSNYASGTVRTCNDGQVVGRSLGVTNRCYNSQLNVNVTMKLEGKTVECVYESGTSTELIGFSMLITGKINNDCIVMHTLQ